MPVLQVVQRFDGVEEARGGVLFSRGKVARLAGLLYLLYIVTLASSSLVQLKPIVWGNAAATARNVVASERMFRVGFMGEVIAALLFLLAAWALYVLLEEVNHRLALLFLMLNALGVAVECCNTLVHFAAISILQGGDYLKVLQADQLQALALLSLNLSGNGNIITGLFFGMWLFPLGYLVLHSGFIPKFFGILLMVDGAALLVCFVQACLFPGYQKLTYPLYPIMFVAEFGFALWLLIKGVKARDGSGSAAFAA